MWGLIWPGLSQCITPWLALAQSYNSFTTGQQKQSRKQLAGQGWPFQHSYKSLKRGLHTLHTSSEMPTVSYVPLSVANRVQHSIRGTGKNKTWYKREGRVWIHGYNVPRVVLSVLVRDLFPSISGTWWCSSKRSSLVGTPLLYMSIFNSQSANTYYQSSNIYKANSIIHISV